MERSKIKSIGSLLNLVLKVSMFIGIILLISFYFIIKGLGIEMDMFLVMFYPCGICFLYLVYQFIELFRMLKINTPFSDNTITYLNRGKNISFIITCFLVIGFISLFFYDYYLLGIKLCVLFICILFFGVGIALYILKELFISALEYKMENDLTI